MVEPEAADVWKDEAPVVELSVKPKDDVPLKGESFDVAVNKDVDDDDGDDDENDGVLDADPVMTLPDELEVCVGMVKLWSEMKGDDSGMPPVGEPAVVAENVDHVPDADSVPSLLDE